MFCTKCGKEVPDGSKFCPQCGGELFIPDKEESPAASAVPVSAPSTATEAKAASADISHDPKATAPHKSNKPKILIASLLVMILVGVGIVFLLKDYTETETATIRNSYLGNYTDVTVEGVLRAFVTANGGNANRDIEWSTTTDKNDQTGVQVCYDDGTGTDVRMQFTYLPDGSFYINWLSDITSPEGMTLEDASSLLHNLYLSYYYGKSAENGLNDDLPPLADIAAQKMNSCSYAAVLCGAPAEYTGDRTIIYQTAYDTEPIRTTAAELLGLDTGLGAASALPSWCTGAYFGNDTFSRLEFSPAMDGTFHVDIYRFVAMDCRITGTDGNGVIFEGDLDNGEGTVAGTLTQYDRDLSLQFTESTWPSFDSDTWMEFYPDTIESANYRPNAEFDICGIYSDSDTAATRLYVWENDGPIELEMYNRGNSMGTYEVSADTGEWISDFFYFTAYSIQDDTVVSGCYNPFECSIELWSDDPDSQFYSRHSFFFFQHT